jgi:hypothetical protein
MAARYDATLSVHALPRALLAVALVLLACHAGLMIHHYRVEELPWLLRQLFDLDDENNLPTWYSSFLLLLASALLWLCGRRKRADGDPRFRPWAVLAAGFLLMAIDEVAGIHETINAMIEMTWALPAAILALLIGLAFIPFLLHLPRRTAVLFALAGGMFLAGAVAIEIVGYSLAIRSRKNTLGYELATLAEEGLEMLGVILFVYALLDYMREPEGRGVDVSLTLR